MKDKELMGEEVKKLLAFCGIYVTVHPLAKICKPDAVELKDHCNVGDYVFIWGGIRTVIGKYSHIQPHTKIWGGGETIIGDYVSIGAGSTLLSAVYNYKAGLHMVDHIPSDQQADVIFGKLIIEDDVYIGANSTIFPVRIGCGAIIGAGSVVTKDIEAWSVYAGNPAKKIGERPLVIIPK